MSKHEYNACTKCLMSIEGQNRKGHICLFAMELTQLTAFNRIGQTGSSFLKSEGKNAQYKKEG